MAQELIYTSVPKGLKAGSDGYCTVAYTDGMPVNLIKILESFSDYSFLNLDDPNLESSPVSFRHYRHTIGNQTYNILSRVAFSGFDYTKRSNKLAHHIVLSPDERCFGGPAWLSIQNEKPLFKTEWGKEDKPELIKHEKFVPQGSDKLSGELSTWKALAGDAGWAGKLAEQYMDNPDKPSYIVYDIEDGDKTLSLIREALLLIPEKNRWQVTYNTYFTVVRGAECNWRCCLKGASVLSKARATPGTLVIDLTSDLPEAEGKELVKAARDGIKVIEEETVSQPVAKEPSVIEKASGGGTIAIFEEKKGKVEENKGRVMEMPKLSLNMTRDEDEVKETPKEQAAEPVEETKAKPKPQLVKESAGAVGKEKIKTSTGTAEVPKVPPSGGTHEKKKVVPPSISDSKRQAEPFVACGNCWWNCHYYFDRFYCVPKGKSRQNRNCFRKAEVCCGKKRN